VVAGALAIAGTVAVPLASGAGTATSGTGHGAPGTIAATITQCVTSINEEERSVTFSGEMSVLPRTAKMAMRVEVEERLPHEQRFHVVQTPGAAAAWRTSEPHVKIFKYLDQVTDLSAPARYRATVRFRWLNARGATIRRASRITGVCAQPAAPEPSAPASAA
jgi:hypothetical protein